VWYKGLTLAGFASIYINFFVFLIDQTKNDEGKLMKNSLKAEQKISRAVLTYISLGIGMVVGPFPMGFLQDKIGHKASLLYILALSVIFNSLLII